MELTYPNQKRRCTTKKHIFKLWPTSFFWWWNFTPKKWWWNGHLQFIGGMGWQGRTQSNTQAETERDGSVWASWQLAPLHETPALGSLTYIMQMPSVLGVFAASGPLPLLCFQESLEHCAIREGFLKVTANFAKCLNAMSNERHERHADMLQALSTSRHPATQTPHLHKLLIHTQTDMYGGECQSIHPVKTTKAQGNGVLTRACRSSFPSLGDTSRLLELQNLCKADSWHHSHRSSRLEESSFCEHMQTPTFWHDDRVLLARRQTIHWHDAQSTARKEARLALLYTVRLHLCHKTVWVHSLPLWVSACLWSRKMCPFFAVDMT